MVPTLLEMTVAEVSMERKVGISNRESAAEEEQERSEHPRIDAGSPPPQDAAGRVGELPMEEVPNRHTSHKAGSRSIAQKEDGARYPDRSAPPSRKVAGAFGREPEERSVANDTKEKDE
jgi:hypothetical protein